MRGVLAAIGLCAALIACASVPREQATQLAKSGATASDLAALEVRDLSGRLDRQAGLMAFTNTWETCTTPGATTCDPWTPSEANAEQTLKLIRAINLRANALTALGDAYRALEQEAAYDAEGAIEPVVGRLADSVNSYASLFRPEAGALIGAPISGVITQGAGLIARDRQRARLMAGSERIREAVALLRQALVREVSLYNTLSAQFADQEGAAVEALFEAGLIARAPILKPLADDLGVTLVPGAEQILTSDRNARIATQAFLRGQANDRRYLQVARYDAILKALSKLEASHRTFEAVGGADIADLNRAIADITALIPEPQEPGQ